MPSIINCWLKKLEKLYNRLRFLLNLKVQTLYFCPNYSNSWINLD